MSISIKSFSWVVIAAFFVSCSTSKKTATSSESLEGMQHVTLDTMEIRPEATDTHSGPPPEYKPAEERTWDLLHTSLDLSFDWKREAVNGKASLTLTPFFYPQKYLRLDAIDFEIHSIAIGDSIIGHYDNTGVEIIIPLSKTYVDGEQLKVEINYTAYPSPSELEPGDAITSDQGLFFIDPWDTIPDLPMQIWTQGETSNNSKWFPTLDQPNERATQEIYLTVPDTMMTLSNGLLMSSKPVAGGLRQDYWKLDLPHAPYLAMIAVGQWDKVTDYWRGRPVEYYVDPGYGPSARAIFAHTTEMMEFFSRKLNYDFVWPKYSQIIVKNFVSGAMENTTAVVFGDFIQFHQEDVIEDGSNDYIVSHELFHHWFGDLVTCESWANLTLNEGFANYSEYLWQEHKYDRERADISRLQELSGYFDQSAYDVHPLIHYHYPDENSMFDAHSYNKGSLVLHMLRDLVGDEAFFSSLHLYLKEHAYEATEVDDLRQAFEKVSGKDLHWFFDQWYFGKGHPVLKINHSHKETEKILTLEITQTQDEKGYEEAFILPIEVAIYHQDTSVETHRIIVDKKSQVFNFAMDEEPLAVIIDPKDILLSEMDHEVPESEYEFRVLSNLAINHRISAFRLMEDLNASMISKLMRDSSFTMRIILIDYLVEHEDTDRLYEMSRIESNPEIQYYLLEALVELDCMRAKDLALQLLETSDRIPVIYAALNALAVADIDEAIHQATHFQHIKSSAILAARAGIYAQKGHYVSLDFFTTAEAASISDDYLEDFIGAMALYMSGQPAEIQDQGLAIIDSDFFLKTKNPQYRRFYMITGLLSQYSEEQDSVYQDKLLAVIKSLYNQETNEYLKGVLKEGLGELLD